MGCSQGCRESAGSYMCTCIKGFRLQDDGKTCIATYNTEALLLFAGKSVVYGVMLKHNRQFVVTNRTLHVVGVSYDGRYVYWTDIGKKTESIVKALEDGSKMEVVLTAGLLEPEDIAVDWLTGNLYITDNSFMHIAVCSNDGNHCAVLVNQNVHHPRGIALLPQQGRMFWSDWGDKPMIAVAQMDGTEARALVTENVHWPNGVTLDWPNNRLYWVDAKLRTIESVNLDGKDRRMVLSGVLKHPYGLAVFENDIYWSDWETKSIQKCNKFNCKNRETVARDRHIYGKLKHIHDLSPKYNQITYRYSHLPFGTATTTRQSMPKQQVFAPVSFVWQFHIFLRMPQGYAATCRSINMCRSTEEQNATHRSQ